ncbi:phage tail protein [Reyranella sp.]|uniref:phage tail protein n=1 Tax=Reyranella sp. TaxID=1929291 RepID=UPI003BAAB8A7
MTDIPAANWNEDDAANATAAPDGAPEGMAPSGVNNVLRAHQGAVKRWYGWSTPKTTGGSSTAYTLTYAVAPASLVDGMTHLVQFHVANGAGATLSVDGVNAIPLHYYAADAWRVAPPGLVAAEEIRTVAYHASSGAYRLLGPDVTGDIVPTARSSARAGTLLCFGQAVARTTYAGLFAAIGTTHGAGDGSTTFNLPDLRGRVVAGTSNMGGADAGTLAGGGSLGAALGGQVNTATTNVGGSASGVLTGQTSGPTSGQGNCVGGGSGQASDWSHVHNVTVSGSLGISASGVSSAFSIVQPTRVLNYAIRI